MANNPFSSAPSGTGGIRNISRQIAAVMVGRNTLSNKGGLTAQDRAALNEQTHTQNVQRDVVKHVLGESAAEKAHGQKLSQGRQSHAQGLADREHAMNLINANTPKDHTASSFSFPGGSASFKAAPKNDGMSQQFNNVPAVDLTTIDTSTKSPKFRARG